jgi:hypothetical protein
MINPNRSAMNSPSCFYNVLNKVQLRFTFLLLLLLPLAANAVTKTWVSASSTDWATGTNWSPSGAPGINDTAVFSSGAVNCTLTAANITIQRMYINGTYSGTVTMGSGSLTLSSIARGFTQSTGTFTASNAALTIAGPFTLSGGTFNASTSPITVNGAFTQSGGTLNLNGSTTTFAANVTFNNSSLTFNAGTSLVQLTQTCSLSVSNEPVISFYKFSFAPTATTAIYTLSSSGSTTIRITEELIYAGNKSMQTNGDSLNIFKHLTVTNTLGNTVGGTSVLYMMGSANCSITGDVVDYVCGLPKVTINKSGATITATKNLTFAKGLVVTAGTLVCDNTTMFCFINSQAITVSADVNDVQFSVGAYTITTPINAKGSFRTRGSGGNVTLNGTVNVEKDVTVGNGFVTTTAGTGKLVLKGAADQKIIGNTVSGNGKLCSIEIDKTGGSVSLLNVISVMGSWTVINGTVIPESSSSVWFTQLSGGVATTIDMRNTSGTLQPFASFGVASGTITLSDDLLLTSNLGILSGSTLNSNNKNISVGSNWNNASGTFTSGTGAVTFTGSGNKSIIRTVSGAANTETFSHLVFNRESGKMTLGSVVQVNNSMTLTKGKIVAATGKHLSFADNATCSGGGVGAYVCGPVRKVGDDAFMFPLGDTLLVDSVAWHPLGMSAPGATGDVFEGIYRAVGQTFGTAMADNLDAVSTNEYWTLQRISGTSTVTATIGFNKNSSIVTNYDDMRVGLWDGSNWTSLGIAAVTPTGSASGLLTATLPVSMTVNPAPITISKKSVSISYAVLLPKLDGGYFQISNGKLLFKYDEEYNDADQQLNFTIYNAERTAIISSSSYPPTMLSSLLTVYGDNRFELNLANCAVSSNGNLGNGFFVLEVTNEKNEKFYLRFKNTNIILVNSNCNPNPQ